MQINSAKDLVVYQKAYELAMKVFEHSKGLPPEERFALTSQNSPLIPLGMFEPARGLVEAQVRGTFVSKLTDCDGENSETDSSLDFAKDCCYITASQHAELVSSCQEIGKMLGSMIKNPDGFLISAR